MEQKRTENHFIKVPINLISNHRFIRTSKHPSKIKFETKYVDNNKQSPIPTSSKIEKYPVKKYKETKRSNSTVCDVCFVEFKNLHGLAVHLRLNGQRYKCDSCDAVFAVRSALLRHKRAHGCSRKIHYNCRCNFCGRVYKWKTEIQSHLFHLHGDLINSGETDDTTSKVSENVTEEKKLNDTNDIISKEPCNLEASDLPLSEISETEISPNNSNDIFPRKNKRIQDKEWKLKFNCKKCFVQLERCDLRYEEGTKNIIELAEATISPKIAKIPKNPPQIMELKEHQNSPKNEVKSVSRKKYPYRFCKKAFSTKRNRYKRVKLFYTMYSSSICRARYTTMKELVNHYLRHHKALKRKTCCVCNEKFYISGLLKRHMALHCVKTKHPAGNTSKEKSRNCSKVKKQNACEGCKKRFWLNSCLKQHEKLCRRMNASMDNQNLVQMEDPTPSIADLPMNLEGSSTPPTENTINDFPKETSRKPSVEEVQSTKSSSLSTSYAVSNAIEHKVRNESLVSSSTLPTENLINNFPKETSRNPSMEEVQSTVSSSTIYAVNNAIEEKVIDEIVPVSGYQIDATEKRNFLCNVCGTRFRTFKNFYLHDRTYSQPRNYSCNICDMAFPTTIFLRDHVFATHSDCVSSRYKFFCNLCNQGFKTHGNLRIHKCHFHKDQPHLNFTKYGSRVCKTCNLIFASYRHFIEHNTYYYKYQVFICGVCNKSFQGMYQLHRHSKFVHYPEETRKSYTYKCTVCDEGFTHETHLQAHKFHVHSDTISTASPIRGHNYALMSNSMAKTEETLQTSLKMYECNICSLNLVSAEDLTIHETEYSAIGDFQCNKCDRRCSTGSVLAKHYSLNHSGEIKNSYKCCYCKEVLTTSTSVQSHMKHFHESPKSADTTNTSKHRKVSEFGSDDYVCITCNTKFANNVELKNHFVKYSDIGQYKCAVCRRRFSDKTLVENHKQKHLELNCNAFPHRCSICNEGFVNSGDINIHVKHFHRNEKFNKVNKKISSDSHKPNSSRHSLPREDRTREEKKKLPARILSFNSIKDVMEYMQKHSKNVLLRYKCPHCEDLSKSFIGMYSHIIDSHGKEKLPVTPNNNVNAIKKNSVVNKKAADVISNVQNTKKRDNINGASVQNTKKLDNIDGASVENVKKRNNIDVAKIGKSFYYICTACNLKVPNLEKFQAHFKEIHEKNSNSNVTKVKKRNNTDGASVQESFYYICTACNLKVPNLEKFQAHFKEKHEKKSNSRSIAIFQESNNMKIHCTCNNIFTDEKSFSEHLRLHSVDRESSSSLTKSNDEIGVVWQKGVSIQKSMSLVIS